MLITMIVMLTVTVMVDGRDDESTVVGMEDQMRTELEEDIYV